MSDYDSSLPIRTEAAGDVDVFLSDATTPSQKLKVNADGSIDTNPAVGSKIIITDGTDDLEINADGSINAIVTAVDLDVRDLAFATDKVDATGSDVTATVTATDLDIRDLVASTDSIQANLFDEAGVAYSAANPLPVEISTDLQGDEVVNFNTSAAVAKDASVNHDYTVTAGKLFIGEEAWISGSGKLKVELLINGVVKFVGFNSTSAPNVRIPLEKIVKANAAEVIRMTITNRDKQAQDLYSTLIGLEV